MSDYERFAQIPKDKWTTVSKSLRSLMSKEQLWANCSGHSWQWGTVSDLLRLLMINEQMSKLLVFFWANRSLALSLTKKPVIRTPKVIDMSKSLMVVHQKWANEGIARFLSKLLIRSFFCKNKRFAQKTNERIPNPEKLNFSLVLASTVQEIKKTFLQTYPLMQVLNSC